ncbi:hypothetical protein A3L11_09125 [Thermococcus siculi]|uniref:Glycoside hydrolase family 38 central domain-containing protein n=1 Tax=Thermococcus siculi TaxID=72803 RepID=A0A2Z2MZD4_9EURY|nr:glycoside hydrolase family 38 C-terminal domain-containing protein [Thermococcus siculi]ASJ09380.1 hypothetical protein A3L11_09125 [Thermococcus siculi]
MPDKDNPQPERPWKVFLVGYAHIDSEWLWKVDETIDVCRFTFGNALQLMKKYDFLTFAQGPGFYYELTEEHHPEIFRDIREMVERVQWRVIDGAYIEFDANMPSGESLIRQFLYGISYLEGKFGVRPRTLYLPDSFGFSATLPKILKGMGIENFATSKLDWNDTNTFPYHIFRWRSRSGDEVLAYSTPGSYSDYLSDIKRILWNIEQQREKQDIPVLMQVFGRGDHGGGPEEVEVQNIARWMEEHRGELELIPTGMDEFFDYVRENHLEELPVFEDEIYLEFHRGVFTTGAWVKRLNRLNEWLILQVEKLYSILGVLYGVEYPGETLLRAWKAILLTQGHDALPASITGEVYGDVMRRNFDVYRDLLSLFRKGLKIIAEREGAGYIVFNPNSWPVSPYIRTWENVGGFHQRLGDGSRLIYLRELPPLGFRGCGEVGERPGDSAEVTETEDAFTLENSHLRVTVSRKTGWVTSIYDKRSDREVLREPMRPRIMWDYPMPFRGRFVPASMFDAWEVYYSEGINKHFHRDLRAEKVSLSERGPLYSSVRARFNYRQFRGKASVIELELGLYADKPYLEVKFRAHWNAHHRFLKLLVPVEVESDKAVFEVPYGAIERTDACNAENPQGRAKYEVFGHRWVDISDGNYGVAVINDSKYGFSWCDGTLGVSLLRSPSQPLADFIMRFIGMNKSAQEKFQDVELRKAGRLKKGFINTAIWFMVLFNEFRNRKKVTPIDRGYHVATLWIYPHEGEYTKGNVPMLAAELNTLYIIQRGPGGSSSLWNLVSVEPAEKVQVVAVKPCERGDCLVLRLFNTTAAPIEAALMPNLPLEGVAEATHDERPVTELPADGGSVKVFLGPYGVKTLLLSLKR